MKRRQPFFFNKIRPIWLLGESLLFNFDLSNGPRATIFGSEGRVRGKFRFILEDFHYFSGYFIDDNCSKK